MATQVEKWLSDSGKLFDSEAEAVFEDSQALLVDIFKGCASFDDFRRRLVRSKEARDAFRKYLDRLSSDK